MKNKTFKALIIDGFIWKSISEYKKTMPKLKKKANKAMLEHEKAYWSKKQENK